MKRVKISFYPGWGIFITRKDAHMWLMIFIIPFFGVEVRIAHLSDAEMNAYFIEQYKRDAIQAAREKEAYENSKELTEMKKESEEIAP